jgi:hypothetical protein
MGKKVETEGMGGLRESGLGSELGEGGDEGEWGDGGLENLAGGLHVGASAIGVSIEEEGEEGVG